MQIDLQFGPGLVDGSIETPLDFKGQLYSLLEERRSIRSFKADSIPRAILNRVIGAGLQAASSKNAQNWRFFVLEGAKRDAYLKITQKTWELKKEDMQKKLKPSLYQFTERFFYTLGNAPVVLLAYSCHEDKCSVESNIGTVFLALQNIITACGAEGLGTCSMGAPLEIAEQVNQFVDIQKYEKEEGRSYHLVSTLVLGRPAHHPPKPPRKTEYRVRYLADEE